MQVLLRGRGLAVGGRKEELVERLAAAAAGPGAAVHCCTNRSNVRSTCSLTPPTADLLPGTEPKALVAEPTPSKQPSKPKPNKTNKTNKTKEFLSDETAAATKIKKKPAAAKKAKLSDESVAMFEKAEKSSFPGAPAASTEKKLKAKAREPVKTSQESSAMEKKTVKRVIRTTVTEVEEVEVSGSKKSKVVKSAGPSIKEKGKAKGKVAAVPKQEKVPKAIPKKLKGPKDIPTDHNLNQAHALVPTTHALVPSRDLVHSSRGLVPANRGLVPASRALARVSDVSEPEEMSNSGAALVAETSSDEDYIMPAFNRRRSPSPDFY